MNYLHESILRVYPNTDLCTQVKEDGTVEALVWNGNSYDPFTYDAALVKTANDAIVVEHQWSDLRETRDKLLAENDWMANSDVTMSDAWKTYRQQLRDLPANTSDPSTPTWPTKPS